MQPDAKQIVEEGYDRIAHLHADWAARARSEERARYLAAFCAQVPAGASVLEMGCGAGGAVTDALAAHYRLTAIDLSLRSIEAARLRTPLARFLHEDMTGADFPAASFAGIVAFYSIIHVPREEQAALLSRIAGWIEDGGLFMAAFGTADEARSYEDDWLGVPMVWSSHDTATTCSMVRAAGFEIESAVVESADEDGQAVSFLWIIARRPGAAVDANSGSLLRTGEGPSGDGESHAREE